MNLYTLYATPGQTEHLVMVASLEIIAEYLRCTPAMKVRMRQETTGTGECIFTMDGRPAGRTGRVGEWKVVSGVIIPRAAMRLDPRLVEADENIGSVVS